MTHVLICFGEGKAMTYLKALLDCLEDITTWMVQNMPNLN